jgi:hypothetical protein
LRFGSSKSRFKIALLGVTQSEHQFCIQSFMHACNQELRQLEPFSGIELIHAVQRVAAQVLETHGAAKVITNLGEYQDSKHLHFHVIFGKANS